MNASTRTLIVAIATTESIPNLMRKNSYKYHCGKDFPHFFRTIPVYRNFMGGRNAEAIIGDYIKILDDSLGKDDQSILLRTQNSYKIRNY